MTEGKKGLIDESETIWGDFQCHKKVKAFNVLHVEAFDRGDKYRLSGVNGGSIDVSSTWFFDHQPEIGGYIVKYEDGYLSYSPKIPFVDGYSEIFFETDGATATLKPSSEQAIEQEIQEKNLNAPRLCPADIDVVIVGESFTVLPSGKAMVCELLLANGFSVRGESACVSKENFDKAIGQKISREDARNKVWMLEGYLLQERLSYPDRYPAVAADDIATDVYTEREIVMITALEKLATLGNGDKIGNSVGNCIACDALDTIGPMSTGPVSRGTCVSKTLHNSDISGARKNVKDIKVVGNGDMFQLLCKASSENEGWMKSTKAMQIGSEDTHGGGCLVQVTTQQRNPDGSYSVAEALAFVPGAQIATDSNDGRKLI